MADEIIIQSIVLGERMVEISYMEERDQSAQVMVVRTMAVDNTALGETYEEFLDSARELVDAGLLLQRSPLSRS